METICLRIEKKGRGGKTVTILTGFTHEISYVRNLSTLIKQTCGTGGTLKDQVVEIQGDFRVRIREILLKEGFQVKG